MVTDNANNSAKVFNVYGRQSQAIDETSVEVLIFLMPTISTKKETFGGVVLQSSLFFYPDSWNSFYWIISYIFNRNTSFKEATYYSLVFGPFLFPIATPIWQIVHAFKGTQYSKSMVFKSLEAFLESAPQLLLQLTILIIKWSHISNHIAQLFHCHDLPVFSCYNYSTIKDLEHKNGGCAFRRECEIDSKFNVNYCVEVTSPINKLMWIINRVEKRGTVKSKRTRREAAQSGVVTNSLRLGMSMQFTDASDKETAEAYEEGLAQLTDNARHVIMHLTELAHDYSRDRKERVIVAVIERHIRKVKTGHKLPALYLMDSIVKNHQTPYRDLFQQNIVSTFASVFITAPEKTKKVKTMDPAWPIVNTPPASSSTKVHTTSPQPNIHVNPAVFNRPRDDNASIFERSSTQGKRTFRITEKKKLELELEVTRKEVEERQSKKTGDERSCSSQRRDPRIREKKTESNSKRNDIVANGTHDCKDSDSTATLSSPSNRYIKDSKSSHKSKSSSFSPSKSKAKSSLSHDRSRKSKDSLSSRNKKNSSSSSSSKKQSSSSSKMNKSSPPPSPKKKGTRTFEFSISPTIRALDQQSRVKELGRIPKKITKRADDSPQPPPVDVFPEEESHVEFNQGRFSKQSTIKRRGANIKDDESTPPEKKKKDMPIDLFGDELKNDVHSQLLVDIQNDPLPSPSTTGWAKFKETNPDEFHTPIRNGRRHGSNDRFNIGNDFRGGRGGFGHRRSRSDRRHLGGNSTNGNDAFGPFDHNQPTTNSIFNNNMIEMVLQNMQNPEHVRNEVIPTIVKQARENLQSGCMNNTQFSELMRQVMTLKEQAMMIQAERRSNDPPFQGHKPQNVSQPPNFQQPMPFFNQQIFNGDQPQQQSRPPFRPHVRDLPQANPEDLEFIKNDPVKTIPIDGESREIRQYDEVCTVVMGDCELKELSFQPGTRRVIIDDKVIVSCELDVKHYTNVMIDGVEHRIKIGAPTRELWIDGQWYECYFDNKVNVLVGMTYHSFFLEGPAPTVKIGERRADLCPGKVNLIVDGDFSIMTSIFLDSKPQKFDIDGKPHVIRFVEGLKTVLINGHPYRTEFGGMPMRSPTQRITNQTSSPKEIEKEDNSNVVPPFLTESENSNGASLENVDESLGSDGENKIDNYKSEKLMQETNETEPLEEPKDEAVDVHNLWKQLLGAGLVSTGSDINEGLKAKKSIPGLDSSIPQEDEIDKENLNPKEDSSSIIKQKEPPTTDVKMSEIKPIILKSHNSTLKERQQGIVNQLYDPSALQCKNCGMRYSPMDMISYSQHLDWHFRMKRREKDNAKKAQSRRWYFERMDWIVSDEIEEEDKENTNTEPSVAEKVIPTVPASQVKEENTCPICKEEFEQFYKDDTDEDGKWLLYNAIQQEDRVFHPQCYQDFTEDRNLNSSTLSHEDSVNQSNFEDSTVSEEGKVIHPMDVGNSGTLNLNVKLEKEEIKEENVDNELLESKEDIKIKSEPEDVVVKEEVEEDVSKSESVTVKSEHSDDEASSPDDLNDEETLDGMVDESPAILSAPKTIRVNLTTPIPGSGSSSPKQTETDNTFVENGKGDHTEEVSKKKLTKKMNLILKRLFKNLKKQTNKKILNGELSGLCSIIQNHRRHSRVTLRWFFSSTLLFTNKYNI
ncbi:PCF11 [Lepeophtheirus salmonis]|uniref:PCF11 n=1 Tax=Lepeophtheirus salmonis TaxID=72036 RepID=A0A7R8D419_LEPSM|nr:PCF11 [Lepeophtheirus salmonis]CAF3022202.1 PCF11 [Lepeophtheirus salmonis]